MGISFGSINTGLPKDIVQQIIAAEKIPVQQMETRKNEVQERKKLVEEVTGYMKEVRDQLMGLQTERNLKEFKVTGNEELVDFEVNKDLIESGSYQFEVSSLSQKSSAMTNGFEDPDNDYVGVGFISYQLPTGETKEIYIDPAHSNLRGIAKLINEDKEIGMRATVVHDGTVEDNPWRIIISLQNTGDDFAAEFPYFYLVDGIKDLYVDMEREAHDALVKLDGFPIELQENVAKDLISGLTIDLLKAKPDEEFTIQITEDVQAIADKINKLIESVNKVLKFIIDQNSIDEKSDTRKTLGGDVSIQTIEGRLRNIVLTPVKTQYGAMRLSDLGIQFQRSGLLQLNENVLSNALKRNLKQTMQTLTGHYDKEEGVRVQGAFNLLYQSAQGYLANPTGTLTSRKNGLDRNIEQIDQQIENRQRLIDQKERMLKDKFARLESTMAKIRGQGNGLAALTANIKDPVQQLG